MRIYVGNLSYETTEEELRKEFEAFGKVDSVSILTDERSGRSKGFAFLEMSGAAEAEAAILGLNGKSLKDRPLTVNEARPRTEAGAGGYRRGGFGGGGDRGKGGGGRGGGGRGGGGRGGRRY